ncbi:MAG: orotate phosphoribosyltransferase [Candidatus Tectomicrobia bacterium]|uniref:Orotate phosphoribosyltransferase n=1 Tax=Tectimicrobiota bacterium TaxID=2528274 RepID=A0A932CNT0_UNCTE|nr:orotate phosphoribosyltransferase [Candidatus Tectomicrobia bacterium]
MADHKEKLLQFLKERSLFFEEITLSSGKRSSYYVDCRVTTYSPDGAFHISEILLGRICQWRQEGQRIDAVGGPMIGADPIVAALCLLSYLRGMPLPGFIVRSEPKKHGKRRLIEGNLRPGDHVVLVDDVITTGGSLVKAIAAVEEAGAHVVKLFSLIDRDEGAREALRGYEYESIFTSQDFLPSSS